MEKSPVNLERSAGLLICQELSDVMVVYDQVVKTIHLNSAKEMFEILSPFNDSYALLDEAFIFRGEASAQYSLLPTALRPENYSKVVSYAKKVLVPEVSDDLELNQRLYEYGILHQFFVNSDNNGLKMPQVDSIRDSMLMVLRDIDLLMVDWLPDSLHELAGLAQHYGLPTRLLDWSLDPFVSLYFAAINALEGSFNSNDSMVLWALNRKAIEGIELRELFTPLKIINPPYGGNDNLRAQKGILTCWRTGKLELSDESYRKVKIDRRPLDILIHETVSKKFFSNPPILMYKFLIPNGEAINLFTALKKIKYNASKLFPGFDGISKTIKEESLLLERKQQVKNIIVN